MMYLEKCHPCKQIVTILDIDMWYDTFTLALVCQCDIPEYKRNKFTYTSYIIIKSGDI
jgi:hypothetical protein